MKNGYGRPEEAANSHYFQHFKKVAGDYLGDKEKMQHLANQVWGKAKDIGQDGGNVLQEMLNNLQNLFSLLKYYLTGQYTNISMDSIILIVASFLYFLSPIDFIPDFIPILGFLDDAAIMSFVLQAIQKEMIKFTEWKNTIDIVQGREQLHL